MPLELNHNVRTVFLLTAYWILIKITPTDNRRMFLSCKSLDGGVFNSSIFAVDMNSECWIVVLIQFIVTNKTLKVGTELSQLEVRWVRERVTNVVLVVVHDLFSIYFSQWFFQIFSCMLCLVKYFLKLWRLFHPSLALYRPITQWQLGHLWVTSYKEEKDH